jgi:hypothetical protein
MRRREQWGRRCSGEVTRRRRRVEATVALRERGSDGREGAEIARAREGTDGEEREREGRSVLQERVCGRWE